MTSEQVGTVTVHALARMFDCTERTIRNLAQAGIVAKAGRARYFFAPSVRGYVIHLRAMGEARVGCDAAADAITESALLKREQRFGHEMKNALMKGRLIDFEDIQPAWERVYRSVMAALMAIPGRARFQIPHLTAADAEIIEKIIRDQLEASAFEEKAPGITPRKVS